MEQEQKAAESANSMGDAQQKATDAMNGLEGFLAPIFEKFPHLPEGGRKFIVSVVPWLALIFGILGVIGLLAAGGIGIIASVLTFGLALPILIQVLISLTSAVLLLLSFNGLKAQTRRGWNLAFYSLVVSIAGAVVGIALGGMYNITGTVIGALIGFYLMFEIRSYYK